MAGFVDKLAKKLGFQRYKNTAYGRTNGIFFNVTMADMTSVALFGAVGAQMVGGREAVMPTVRAYVKRPGGIDLNGINAFLKKKWKGLKVFEAQANELSVWMNINSAWAIKAENVMTLLQEFSAYLSENGYVSACNFCSGAGNLGYTVQDGQVMEVCEACHEKLQGFVEEFKAQREATGSYAKGTLGAVLGGIIGIIPWVLIWMLGFIASVSGLIMAWLSYKGYQLTGGKKGRGMVWILIAVLIVFTYVGVVASIYAQIASEGYQLNGDAFLIVLGAPFMPEYFDTGIIWGRVALGWLFAGLGSFGLIRRAGRESGGKDLAVKRISKEQ